MKLTASLTLIASLAAVHVASGCRRAPEQVGPGEDVMCTMEARAGIMVEVVDSVSGAPAARGARVVARGTTFTDSTAGPAESDEAIALAYERDGTYTVTVTKPGYRPWTQAGVVVTKDQCHVRSVRVIAKLQR